MEDCLRIMCCSHVMDVAAVFYIKVQFKLLQTKISIKQTIVLLHLSTDLSYEFKLFS